MQYINKPSHSSTRCV